MHAASKKNELKSAEKILPSMFESVEGNLKLDGGCGGHNFPQHKHKSF